MSTHQIDVTVPNDGVVSYMADRARVCPDGNLLVWRGGNMIGLYKAGSWVSYTGRCAITKVA